MVVVIVVVVVEININKGGIIALLLQDHRTVLTEVVCSSQYMVT